MILSIHLPQDLRARLPRVASAILALVHGRPRPDKFVLVTLPLASGTLAAALGLAPETFSRSISHMVAEGVLHRLSPRRYQVLDLRRLTLLAQSPD